MDRLIDRQVHEEGRAGTNGDDEGGEGEGDGGREKIMYPR